MWQHYVIPLYHTPAFNIAMWDTVARPDFDDIAERYYRRLDVILPEDNEAVEVQQTGLNVPVQAASRFTHMETLCHAFDNWIVDRITD